MLINFDMPPGAAFQTAFCCQCGIGLDSGGKDHSISKELIAAIHLHFHTMIQGSVIFYSTVVAHMDAEPGQFSGKRRCHLPVNSRQDMVSALDDGDFQTFGFQIFCGFQPDETGTDYDGTLGICQTCSDIFHIFECPEVENIFNIAFFIGSCASGDQKFIVGFFVLLTVCTADCAFLCPVNTDDFTPGTHFNIEPGGKFLRLHDQQILFFGDHAPQMIRQSTVGIGDKAAFFQKQDLAIFIKSAQPCCRTCACGNSADNDYFHKKSPSICIFFIPTAIR